MSAAADRASDWTWRPERFAETFGNRGEGRFAERWPEGKRIAIALTFDTQGDVDAAARNYQTCFWESGAINYCDLTMRQYDLVEGLPRVLRILRKYDVRATFPTCGATADWYPEEIRTIVDEGHELAVHGYHHMLMTDLSDDEERLEIERATEAIARISDGQPQGWRSPVYSVTDRTLDLLRDAGYVWNSDFHDCDFPYVLTKDGRDLVEIPAGDDDWNMNIQYAPGAPQMGGTPFGTADGVLSTIKADFDLLYEESVTAPRVFQWCMHPKISGRPFRAAVLDRAIAHMKEHEGVWFATCAELAALA